MAVSYTKHLVASVVALPLPTFFFLISTSKYSCFGALGTTLGFEQSGKVRDELEMMTSGCGGIFTATIGIRDGKSWM
ncbi:hypothetical protein BKA64DRAFT_2629 [Cadophora sp. MPI-SDFR-AT-0126]|nr:hypothetical protein BKA64DRAFT_2629 [Leotiomycetes sp. MPI-SDFR-AT-0126]